jgi:hypothetical protein
MKGLLPGFCAILIFSAGQGAVCADLEANLVARWAFQDGSLKSDVGDYSFAEGGQGTLEAGDGKVTLRGHKFLMVPEITSAALPDLAKNVTIWARLRFDTLPEKYEVGVIGFQDNASSGDWASMVFTMLYIALENNASQSGLAFHGLTQNGAEFGVGTDRFQTVKAGEFFNVAIVFNGESRTATLWVSTTGQTVQTNFDASSLQNFGGFGLGQLKAVGADCAITFDEVRIYSTALDASWLEEITPEK